MQMLINGKSVSAKETFDVLNPATLERIDSAPRATTAELPLEEASPSRGTASQVPDCRSRWRL